MRRQLLGLLLIRVLLRIVSVSCPGFQTRHGLRYLQDAMLSMLNIYEARTRRCEEVATHALETKAVVFELDLTEV